MSMSSESYDTASVSVSATRCRLERKGKDEEEKEKKAKAANIILHFKRIMGAVCAAARHETKRFLVEILNFIFHLCHLSSLVVMNSVFSYSAASSLIFDAARAVSVILPILVLNVCECFCFSYLSPRSFIANFFMPTCMLCSRYLRSVCVLAIRYVEEELDDGKRQNWILMFN